jgi:hypothetical protein
MAITRLHRKALLGAPGAMMSPVWWTTSCADLARARVLATKCWYLHATACASCHRDCLYTYRRYTDHQVLHGAACGHSHSQGGAAAAGCLPQARYTALMRLPKLLALATVFEAAC